MSLLTATVRRPPAVTAPQPAAYGPVVLRADTGEALELDLGRWHDPATTEEQALLATVDGPVIDLGCGPGVQIGMDTPQVTAGLLDDALEALDTTSAALGLAEDGGWWAIGLRQADARVFLDVPMSTSRTGAAQLARLHGLGLDVTSLPTLVDLDTIADLPAVVERGTAIRTAALARTLGVLPFVAPA